MQSRATLLMKGHVRWNVLSGSWECCLLLGGIGFKRAHKGWHESELSLPAGVPERRQFEVPPIEWIKDMRTPPADIILAEFHRQKGDWAPSDSQQLGSNDDSSSSPTSVVDHKPVTAPSTAPDSPRISGGCWAAFARM